MIDEPPAQNRPERSSDSRGARPRTDSLAAVLLGKRRADDRETAWDQQRAADTLKNTGKDKFAYPAGKSAPDRGHGE